MIRVDPIYLFFYLFERGVGWLVGYCMMIKIAQMFLSYYLNKLRKDCFLKQNGLNDPESAARARGAICRTFKSIQMIQSARISAERCYSTPWFFYEWRWEFEIASAVIKLPMLHVCCYSTVFSFDSLLVLRCDWFETLSFAFRKATFVIRNVYKYVVVYKEKFQCHIILQKSF